MVTVALPGESSAGRRKRAVHHVSVESESEQQATRRPVVAATGVCRSILDGATTPYDGARQIAAMCRETAIHPPVELHTFVYADSEWDERPEDGNIFAEGVVAAARDLARADQER